tara:strand:+ start:190 stop:333 length:144 start_codon:yes stop_codon:yes gene_type:complete
VVPREPEKAMIEKQIMHRMDRQEMLPLDLKVEEINQVSILSLPINNS